MKAIFAVLALFTVAAFLGACAREDATHSNSDTAMNDDTQSIALTGDFKGPLGLQLWSLRNYAPDDLAGTLDRVHDMGFREVELAGTYGLSPASFRAVLDAAGLKATAMHASYELLRDSLGAVLNEAEALGVEYVGVAWIPHESGQPFTMDMARAAARDFNTWGAAARERGLRFFYHVHGYEYRPAPDGTTPFDVMVAETDPAAVTYEMDVFWVTNSGTDPAALLRKYPDRWALMHVKDMKIGTPTNNHSGGVAAGMEVDVPVGTGMIDFGGVLKAAADVGVRRYYIEDESSTPLESIPRSISYLATVSFP